jgi:alpha-tubulin suppressor-like RCC1 family protein
MRTHIALLTLSLLTPLLAKLANAQTATQIQARFETNFALRGDQTVMAWGANDAEQTNVPSSLAGVVAVSAGHEHGLALTSSGTVVAWGRDSEGEVAVPPGLRNVIQISAGAYHNLALTSAGTVVAWGDNYSAECNVPNGLGSVKQVSAGGGFSVALKNNGIVAAWGDNQFGETSVPLGLTNVTQISAGRSQVLALRSNGTVTAWGDNSSGQATVPANLTNVVKVAAGYHHSVALKSDGTVVVWGNNGFHERNVPAGLTGVIQVAAGYGFSMALKADGAIVGWGDGYVSPPAGTLAPPPQMIGPGTSASPGQAVTTPNPSFTWQPVLGADSYDLYVEHLTSSYQLVYNSRSIGRSVPAGQTSYTILPAFNLFHSGNSYRWNMTSHNGSGNGPASASFHYFTIGDVNPNQQLRITSIKTSALQPFHQGQSITYTIAVGDANGNLVSGATVTADDGIISQSKQANPTDSNGRTNYSTTVPPNLSDGVYQIVFQATAPGYADSAAVTTVGQLSGGGATPQLATTFPLGGELFAVSSNQTISATGNGPFYEYLFEFSTDDGAIWSPLGKKSADCGHKQ